MSLVFHTAQSQEVKGGEFGIEDPNKPPFVPSKGLTSEGVRRSETGACPPLTLSTRSQLWAPGALEATALYGVTRQRQPVPIEPPQLRARAQHARLSV